MSKHLNRPIIGLNEDGSRTFRDPGDLLHRLTLGVSVYEAQMRVELGEWRPGMDLGTHLVWQHHNLSGHRLQTSALDSTGALASTSEWLVAQGWPGVRF